VEHPTQGYEPESTPPTEPVDKPGTYVPPWTEQSGLDYTIAAPTPPTQLEPERQTIAYLPIGIVAFLSAIVGTLFTIGLLSALGYFEADPTAVSSVPVTTAVATTTPPTTVLAAADTDPAIVEAVWAKVNPSVVTVHVGTDTDIIGSGSGVAIGDGYIATNHHVIEGTEVTRIILQDGTTYIAEVVGSDAYTDLAVLKVTAAGLVPVQIGDAEDLSIGQVTIAVGNPLGQSGGSSLTVGVLSALSRRVDIDDDTTLFGMLQTDAPITNGSSGGALVDDEGRLIGITSAIGLSEAGAEGIGYAIPVNLVQRVTDEIIETGEVRHAFLGIRGRDAIEDGADGAEIPAGAEIEGVDPADGAAGRAGIVGGDVIVSIEGIEIRTMNELVIQLRLYRVGETIDLQIQRDGDSETVSVTLDERPEDL